MISIEPIKNADVPYDLLFLADEDDDQIAKYRYTATFFAAWKDGEVVGIIGLKPCSKAAIEIVNVAVSEKLHNQKIGTGLLEKAIAYSKEKQYREMVIKTGNCGIKHLYLYQRCGFRFDSINKNYMVDNYPNPIFENGIQCMDQIVLKQVLS